MPSVLSSPGSAMEEGYSDGSRHASQAARIKAQPGARKHDSRLREHEMQPLSDALRPEPEVGLNKP